MSNVLFFALILKREGIPMPKKMSPKQILMACQMSFDGKSNTEIAKQFDVKDVTVSNWRKLEIWQEFEAELVDAYKQHLMTEFATPTPD